MLTPQSLKTRLTDLANLTDIAGRMADALVTDLESLNAADAAERHEIDALLDTVDTINASCNRYADNLREDLTKIAERCDRWK